MGSFASLLFVTVLLFGPSNSSQSEQLIDYFSLICILLYIIDVLVLPLHAEKQFYCLTPNNTYSYTWRVNRTWVASNSTFPEVVYITSQTLSNGSLQGSLTFRAHDQVNNTDIDCFVTNGAHTVTQLDYNIVIQGLLFLRYVYIAVQYYHSIKLLLIHHQAT